MRAIIRPSLAPDMHVDVTHALTAAIAHELSRIQSGNDVLNWLEAERLLGQLLVRPTAGPVEARPVAPTSDTARREEPKPRRARVVRERALVYDNGPPYRG